LAQLWGEAIGVEDGVPFLQIRATPDGGRLKNPHSERKVPLHPALVEAVFLGFVKRQGQGPLFYRRSSGDPNRRHAAKGCVANYLADWVRQQGFDNPRKAPNHALRHWFTTAAASRVGIPDSLADAVQGHAGRSVAATYRHFDLKTLAREVANIAVPGHPAG
jgi:integrase